MPIFHTRCFLQISDDLQLSVHIWSETFRSSPGPLCMGKIYQVKDFTIKWQDLDPAIMRDLSPKLSVSADIFLWAWLFLLRESSKLPSRAVSLPMSIHSTVGGWEFRSWICRFPLNLHLLFFLLLLSSCVSLSYVSGPRVQSPFGLTSAQSQPPVFYQVGQDSSYLEKKTWALPASMKTFNHPSCSQFLVSPTFNSSWCCESLCRIL